MQKIYSLSAEQSERIEMEYEIKEILLNLKKAIIIVGDVTLSDAIKSLQEKII